MIISNWKRFMILQIKISSFCSSVPFYWDKKRQNFTILPASKCFWYMFGLIICFLRMVVMNMLFYTCVQSNTVQALGKANCVFFANGAGLLNLFNFYNFKKRYEIVEMLNVFISNGAGNPI